MKTDFLISRAAARGKDGKPIVWQIDTPEPAGPVIADINKAFPGSPVLCLVHTEK
jgi:hypothetical protein